jgi:hypothetical protein
MKKCYSNRFDANNPNRWWNFQPLCTCDQVKVGDAAQILSIGAKYEVFERVSFDANYRLAQKLYASIDPTNFN